MIKLENISYSYSANSPVDTKALNGVSICIEENEFIGIAGRTGSGKTTLAQILAGIIYPSDGKIHIDGQEYTDLKVAARALRKKVGIVFQYPEHQLFEETVYRDIAFGPRNAGLSENEIDSAVRRSAELMQISEEMLGKSPFELSGGQKRRVAIAGIIATSPSVIILDEPAAGLDPIGRKRLFDMLRQIKNEKRISVVLISHSMEDLAENTQRIILLDDGRAVKDAPTENVFSSYALLKECGLDIPEITAVTHLLRKGGMKLSHNIFTIEDACREIEKAMEDMKKC